MGADIFGISGFRRSIDNVINLGLEFFGSWKALIKGQDDQGGQGFALVSPEHPEAAFEAAFEAIFGVI